LLCNQKSDLTAAVQGAIFIRRKFAARLLHAHAFDVSSKVSRLRRERIDVQIRNENIARPGRRHLWLAAIETTSTAMARFVPASRRQIKGLITPA
jgi:hypothetical protein